MANVRNLIRYGLSLAAPASVAAAHFLVQLMVLSLAPPAQFGQFVFLMAAIQFGYGLSNALLSTPLTILRAHAPDDTGSAVLLAALNLLFAVAIGVVVLLLGFLTGGTDGWLLPFSVFAVLAMVRWFGRAFNYAEMRPERAAASDILYAVALVAMTGWLYFSGAFDMAMLAAAFVVASLAGLLVLGPAFLQQHRFGSGLRFSDYGPIWKDQSRWTLLGVVTTEFTSNVHIYLVTLLAGAARFAPMGAASLFLRPVSLSITSLSQLERPAISRQIAAGDIRAALASRRRFHILLLLAWAATAVLAAGVWLYAPGLIVKPDYSVSEIGTAVILYFLIALVLIWQEPNSVTLQAARAFRPLAFASVVSSLFSIAGVLAALAVAPPVYSLLAILAGQVVMALIIAVHARRWRVNALA
ncbi:hypothetical protein NOF55_15065 [Rhizobiaceae bacterium BDR2-2]|uniref:Membrane protein involved in the export of O-antigen and teichoic acid n=1 Tax=Ectorhizobium quercum TaxID=2965071 RepID=A0AAE3MZX5_9HYPH|nr:hypothetical protein [Ectorhizobium quercum]MCX8998433.1 hypothetical protein [Ectorhizobium quercum]